MQCTLLVVGAMDLEADGHTNGVPAHLQPSAVRRRFRLVEALLQVVEARHLKVPACIEGSNAVGLGDLMHLPGIGSAFDS